MDNVLVDFPSGISKLSQEVINEYESNLDEVPNIFSLMEPLEGAIDSFKILSQRYDTYILSTAPWENSSAWSDKVKWVKKYLGENAYKRLILTHHKNLNHGDYLIDDRKKMVQMRLKENLSILGQRSFQIGKVFALIL